MRLCNFSCRLLVGTSLLLVWFGMTAQAQISPGPLARAHEQLDSTSQCFICHGGRMGSAGINERCVQCHTEIGRQLEHDTGLHGKEDLLRCAGCHPDHAGRDFELIEWDEGAEKDFDHGRTGWPLTGAHRDKDCSQCHRPAFQTAAIVGLMERKDPGNSRLGLQPVCAGCHTDVHRGTLDQDCSSCHTDAAWKPASDFDHATTLYALDGKHGEVKCDACHKPTAGEEVLFSPLAHQQCSSCHDDTHRGAFGPKCSTCHSTAGFKVLKLNSFDHSKTKFPLRGKHRTVECTSCHSPATGTYKKDNFSTCSSCHSDAHAGTARLQGASTDCATCHDERGFRPSTLTVPDHDKTNYALDGAHRKVACESCHKREPGNTDRLGSATVRLQPAHDTCTACHDDSHSDQLKAREEDGGACASCHTVAAWKPSTFGAEQHNELEFRLDGAHLRAECADCHGPRRKDLAALPGKSELGPAGVALTLVEDRCVDCHVDVHEARFEKTCDHCHGTQAFRPSTVGTEAHASFRYDLQGAHRTVPCVACHQDLSVEPREVHLLRASVGAPISFAAPFETCSSCHDSPHRGQFGDRERDCSGCHDQRDFIPAPRFDHDMLFPLVGEHAGVPCMDCHVRGVADDGAEYSLYRPLARECESCHKPGSLRPSGGQ